MGDLSEFCAVLAFVFLVALIASIGWHSGAYLIKAFIDFFRRSDD